LNAVAETTPNASARPRWEGVSTDGCPEEHYQPFQYPQLSGGPADYDPRQLGGMMRQAQQQQPDLLQGMLGQGGALSNPMAKMAMAGVAAIAAQRLMGNSQGGGGLLGGILGQR